MLLQAQHHWSRPRINTVIISLHKFFLIWQMMVRLYRRKDMLNTSLLSHQFHTVGNQKWDTYNRKQWHQMTQTKCYKPNQNATLQHLQQRRCQMLAAGNYRSLRLWQFWSPACCRNWATFLPNRTTGSWTWHMSVQKRLHPMTGREYLWQWLSGYSSKLSVVSKIYFHAWKI